MNVLLDLITEDHTIVALQEELIVWKTVRAVRRVIAAPHRPKHDARALLAVVGETSPAPRPAAPARQRGTGVGRGNSEHNQRRRAEVLELLQKNARPLSTQECADALGRTYQAVYGLLKTMCDRGLLTHNAFGRWCLNEVVPSNNAG